MAPEEPSGTRPAGPVVLRIKLRYDDVDVMVQRFAPNVGKSGLFLPTKSLQPIGAEIKFELRLANEQPVLVGLGRVKAVKEPDPQNPKAVFGMAIELMRVTRESRDLILRMLERRRVLGLAETAIPMPADIDAARRSDFVDTSVKDASSGAVPAIVMPPQDSQEHLLTSPRRPTGPIAVAKVQSVSPLAPEPTRRRRVPVNEVIETASGPIAQASVPGLDDDVDVAAVLARARLLAGSDLDAELDALRAPAAPIEIGVEAASAELAKAIGGAAVRRGGWAPPPAVSNPEPVVEAPVVVPEEPPAKPALEAVPGPVPEPVLEPVPQVEVPIPVAPEAAATAVEAEPAGALAAPVDADAAALERARDAAFHRRLALEEAEDAARAREVITEPRAPTPVPELHDEQEPDDLAAREHEVEPEQIHDEIHQLTDNDYEEVEHTQLGDVPQPTFDEHAYATRPSADDEALADRLDAHLAAVEAEHEHDDLGIGEASGTYDRDQLEHPTTTPRDEADYIHRFAAPEVATDTPVDDFDAEFDRGFANARMASEVSVAPYDAGHEIAVADSALAATVDGNAAAFAHDAPEEIEEVEEVEEIEEIDDFEILAEADAEDADLLQSHGEADVSGSRELEAPARPSHSDFASRLDLGEESDIYPAAPQQHYYRTRDDFAHDPGPLDPRVASAGHALAAFDDHDSLSGFERPNFTPTPVSEREIRPIFDEGGSHSYTAAEAAPEESEFDAPHAGFATPHAFDESDVIDIASEKPRSKRPQPNASVLPPTAPTPIYNEPYVLRGPPPGTAPAVDEVDLESALEALDVDLDDLSIPHASTELARDGSKSQPVRGRPTIRPPSTQQAQARQTGASRVTSPSQVAARTQRPPRGAAPRATTDDGVLIDFDDDGDDEP